MAKAKEIIGLDCDANVLDWAAEVLRVRFTEIVEARDAAIDFTDIEGVHQMRVAARRWRSAVRDFLLFVDKRPLKRARREIKEIADALGAVRDQDVAILALEQLRSEAKIEEITAGVEMFINERTAIRSQAQNDLIRAIAADRLHDLAENIASSIEKSVRAKAKKSAAKQIRFNQAGKTVVGASLNEFLRLGTSLYNPFEIEELHEMRIAAKRLRYAIELYVSCWGEKIAPFAEEVAKMQSLLGEVHDADVWILDLSARLQDGEREQKFPAAIWLLSKFVKTRTANYRQALELWSKWQTEDFGEKMRLIM